MRTAAAASQARFQMPSRARHPSCTLATCSSRRQPFAAKGSPPPSRDNDTARGSTDKRSEQQTTATAKSIMKRALRLDTTPPQASASSSSPRPLSPEAGSPNDADAEDETTTTNNCNAASPWSAVVPPLRSSPLWAARYRQANASPQRCPQAKPARPASVNIAWRRERIAAWTTRRATTALHLRRPGQANRTVAAAAPPPPLRTLARATTAARETDKQPRLSSSRALVSSAQSASGAGATVTSMSATAAAGAESAGSGHDSRRSSSIRLRQLRKIRRCYGARKSVSTVGSSSFINGSGSSSTGEMVVIVVGPQNG